MPLNLDCYCFEYAVAYNYKSYCCSNRRWRRAVWSERRSGHGASRRGTQLLACSARDVSIACLEPSSAIYSRTSTTAQVKCYLRQVFHLVIRSPISTQPGCPSVSKRDEYRSRKLAGALTGTSRNAHALWSRSVNWCIAVG